MSDHAGGGKVTIRLDEEKAFNKSLTQSNDNTALGLWRGGTAIPFIKSLYDKQTMLLRFTPYNSNSYTVTFPISGTRNAVDKLAAACNWKP